MFEGEVTEILPVEEDNPHGGYGKLVTHVLVSLRTARGGKQLRLDPSVYDSLKKQAVDAGDVIYIEANSGAVKVVSSEFVL